MNSPLTRASDVEIGPRNVGHGPGIRRGRKRKITQTRYSRPKRGSGKKEREFPFSSQEGNAGRSIEGPVAPGEARPRRCVKVVDDLRQSEKTFLGREESDEEKDVGAPGSETLWTIFDADVDTKKKNSKSATSGPIRKKGGSPRRPGSQIYS